MNFDKKDTKICFALLMLTWLSFSTAFCSGNAFESPCVSSHQTDPKQKITYKIISGISNTWGYDIYVNGVLTIHQLSRPAVAGNLGFNSKANAEKVAKLVVDKIKHNQMPPTVSINEMKKLNALE